MKTEQDNNQNQANVADMEQVNIDAVKDELTEVERLKEELDSAKETKLQYYTKCSILQNAVNKMIEDGVITKEQFFATMLEANNLDMDTLLYKLSK